MVEKVQNLFLRSNHSLLLVFFDFGIIIWGWIRGSWWTCGRILVKLWGPKRRYCCLTDQERKTRAKKAAARITNKSQKTMKTSNKNKIKEKKRIEKKNARTGYAAREKAKTSSSTT